mmetsp:Transcript_18168/g.41222  ORF Transcript_18168/g.41222 Transcript_18168/m.41222 type:complete len:354 (-) Transcript_18168:1519-2580(-)
MVALGDLTAPKPIKMETSSLDSFLEKLLQALKQHETDMAEIKTTNKKLAAEVDDLKAQVKASGGAEMLKELKDLSSRFKDLEARLAIVEQRMENKAEATQLQEVKEVAERGERSLLELSTEFTGFKSDIMKSIKGLDGRLSSLQSQVSEQINHLADSKANKSEVTELGKKTESLGKVCDNNTDEVQEMRRRMDEFLQGVDSKIEMKADRDSLNNRITRVEVDDLLSSLSSLFSDKQRKASKDVQDLRDDLDVLLTMVMQDANVAAGMLKCLSCEKPVLLHRPGPPPGSGREPVITQGTDGMMYRAAKEDYSPVWASSGLGRRSESPARTRTESPQKPSGRTRPASAKVRSSVS